MDFDTKLEHLQKQTNETVSTVKAAAAEDRQKLQQRMEQTQADMNLALQGTRQRVDQVADRADSGFAQMKADASKKMDDVKAKIAKRRDQLNASDALIEADWAEADAYDAIDYAEWATESAGLAILDALDARAHATELAEKAR
jgi:uncharacterized phage infection (PIP) family protein YhgE